MDQQIKKARLYTRRGDYVATINDLAFYAFRTAPDVVIWGPLPRIFLRKDDTSYYESDFSYAVVEVTIDGTSKL